MSRPINIILYLMLGFCLVSCSHRSKLIPRSEMVDIYEEMFLTDQWLISNSAELKKADSLRLYEPIFNKYGYTTDDFRSSSSYYLQDPRRFARILQRTVSRLSDEKRRLDALSDNIDKILAQIENYRLTTPEVKKYYDSLFFAKSSSSDISIIWDSAGMYIPDFFRDTVESSGTVFTHILDTLAPLRNIEKAPEEDIIWN